MNAFSKFTLLSCLYFAQGLPFGFFTQALPVLMRKQGISLASIGLSHILFIPWVLKFLWAPFLDRYGSKRLGHWRSWILPLQFLTIGAVCLIGYVESLELKLLMPLFFVVYMLTATQDIATDGLAVNILEPGERGVGNGLQVAGYRFGMIIGGGVLLIVHHYIGWKYTFFIMGGLLLFSTIPVFFLRETSTTHPISSDVSYMTILSRFISRPGMVAWSAILFLYKFGEWFALGMIRPFLVDRGYSLTEIGLLFGTTGTTAALAGSILGGWIAGRLGHYRSLILFQLLQSLSLFGYAYLVLIDIDTLSLYIVVIAEQICCGMTMAALFTVMMDFSDVKTAATDYTVQTCIVMSSGIASMVSGFSAQYFGYLRHFSLAVVICMVTMVITAICRPENRQSSEVS